MTRPEPQKPSEAVARFDDPTQLETAIAALQSNGFDRADISFLAREGFLGEHAAAGGPEATQREAPIETTDVRQGRTLVTSMAAVVAAFAAAGFTVATGGAAALAAGIAVAAGLGVGAAGAAVGQKAERSEHHFLDEQLAQGGVLVWVRTRDADAEQRALSILRVHGGTEVRLHELPATA
jgi:hypothetical protein